METEDIVRELIATPARISCILLEDPEDRVGITVLYVDGSSFFKPIENIEERNKVWEMILAVRTRNLVELEFDDVLFSPRTVSRVDIKKTNDGSDLMISFVNHTSENTLWYPYEEFKNEADRLLTFLSLFQDRRADIFFDNSKTKIIH